MIELAEMEHSAAHEEYRVLLDQQFRLSEKIRIGALTLNAASLVALLSALGNDDVVGAIGGVSTIRYVGAFFLVGSLFGAASIYFEGVQATNRVTEALPRLGSATRIRGLLHTAAVEVNDKKLGQELEKQVVAAPIWSRSRLADNFLALSSWGWVAGTVTVLLGLVTPELQSLIENLRPGS